MSVIDNYVSLHQVCIKNNIPEEIIKNIFGYEKKNIMKNINNKNIYNKVYIQYSKNLNQLSYHLLDLPYKINNIYDIKNIIENILKNIDRKDEFLFSNFCCNNIGCVFSKQNYIYIK